MTEPAKIRRAEDAFGKRATFDDIVIGRELESFEWIVTEDDIEKQCRTDEDYHPWYVTDSPWDGRIAPPQIQYRPPRWQITRTYNIRGVFYRWEFENLKPIKPGQKIMITGRILDKWIRNEREYVKFESVGTDEDGERVFVTQRTHVLDMIERTAPREGAGIDSGHKPEKI